MNQNEAPLVTRGKVLLSIPGSSPPISPHQSREVAGRMVRSAVRTSGTLSWGVGIGAHTSRAL
jgi:hypothetical protein